VAFHFLLGEDDMKLQGALNGRTFGLALIGMDRTKSLACYMAAGFC
jgi:hypothetical protein